MQIELKISTIPEHLTKQSIYSERYRWQKGKPRSLVKSTTNGNVISRIRFSSWARENDSCDSTFFSLSWRAGFICVVCGATNGRYRFYQIFDNRSVNRTRSECEVSEPSYGINLSENSWPRLFGLYYENDPIVDMRRSYDISGSSETDNKFCIASRNDIYKK